MVEFTKNHRSTLIKLFNLPKDIRFSSDSTFRNIIYSLYFDFLAVLFNIGSQQTLPINLFEWMAIDGKSIKSTLVGSNSSYQNFVSIVSVYSHPRGPLVRHKVMENQQESEICIVEQLIRGLSGSHVVIERGCTALSKKNTGLNY